MPSTHYDTLGVAFNATDEDIKKAYRRLAMKYHPDRQSGKSQADIDAAESSFKTIKNAFESVETEAKRAIYNRTVQPKTRYDRASKTEDADEYDDPYAKYDRYRDDFEEIIRRQQQAHNKTYDGHDFDWNTRQRRKTERTWARNKDVVMRHMVQINSIFEDRTYVVNYKVDDQDRTATFVVPKGTVTNHKITVKNGGSREHTMLPAGDLIINIFVNPDLNFIYGGEDSAYLEGLEDEDIAYEASVDVFTLMTGGTIIVPTIDGKKLEVTIRPNTQNKAKIRVPNRGLFFDNSSGVRGMMFIIIHAKLPEKLTQTEIDVLKEFKTIIDSKK